VKPTACRIWQTTALTPQNQATLDVQNAIANTLANKTNERLGRTRANAPYDPKQQDVSAIDQHRGGRWDPPQAVPSLLHARHGCVVPRQANAE
jgi:hypothetical protein